MTYFSFFRMYIATGVGLFLLLLADIAYAADSVKLSNPLSSSKVESEAPQEYIGIILANVIRSGLAILGSLALVGVIIGGFMWLTSGGASDKTKKGLTTMGYSIIGMFVVFFSYAILQLFFSQVGTR